MNTTKILAKDYFMLKYQHYERLSPFSPPGKIQILTSNAIAVVRILQSIQELPNGGRFVIDNYRSNVVDVILTPKADPDYIYNLIFCRINRLRDELYKNITNQIEESPSWKANDEIPVEARLVENESGGVEVQPVLKSLKPSDSTITRKLPSYEELLQMGIILETK